MKMLNNQTDLGPNEYLALLYDNIPSIKDTVHKARSTNCSFNDKIVEFSFLPVFFTKKEYRLIKDTAEQFTELLSSSLFAFVNSSQDSSFISFSNDERTFINLDKKRYFSLSPISRSFIDSCLLFLRFDALLSSNKKELYFCEINCNALGGMAETAESFNSLERLSFFQKYKSDNSLSSSSSDVLSILADKIKDFVKAPGKNFAIAVLFDSEYNNAAELFELKKYFADFFNNFSIVDIRDLKFDEKSFLFYSKKTVLGSPSSYDYVFNYLILSDLVKYKAQLTDFIDNYKRSKTVFFPGSFSYILQDKRYLAYLYQQSQKEGIFSSSDAKFIKKHIPETLLVDDSLTEERLKSILDNKDDYVLKSSCLYAGKSCYFLSDFSKPKAEKLIEDIIKSKQIFILQKKIISDKFSYVLDSKNLENFETRKDSDITFKVEQLGTVFGLFCIDKKYTANYIRAGYTNVITSANNCITSASYIKIE